MNNANWILLGLIIITLGLYIFASIKKISLMEKITSAFLLPLMAALNILFLQDYLPDSEHTIWITAISLGLSTISEILFLFENKKVCKIFFSFTYLLAIAVWLELYRSVFYINRIATWLEIVMTIFYVGVAIFILIKSGKKKIFEYALFLIAMAVGSLLHFTSLVRICYDFGLSAVLMFLGTSLGFFHIGFYILDINRFHFKYAKKINLLLFTISQGLIAFSNFVTLGNF